MGDGKCCYCGRPAVKERRWGAVVIRAWCRPCLDRVHHQGIVDFDEYPRERETRRCGAPGPVDAL